MLLEPTETSPPRAPRHAPRAEPVRGWAVAGTLAVLALAFSAIVAGTLSLASAQRQYRVRSGQTLAAIAQRHHVSVSNLAGANRLRTTARLMVGQMLVIPEEGVAYVAVGQTLSHVARENNVTAEQLARANRIDVDATLQPGQRLVLPGHEHTAAARQQYGRPRNPGVVTFFRFSSRETLRIRVLDSRGRPRRAARTQLSRLMRERQSDATHEVDERLMRLLVQVSDNFGGRKLYIISGFRTAGGYTRESSRHTQGRAVDFRVDRVANTEVRDYCRQLPDTGVGYYPNSSFVHLDTRSDSAYWVDYSRSGEAPRYRRGGAASAGGDDDGAADASEPD
ncbi:MAG: LysM peptidoglycan-binding domain-containing protein [Polyangiales bacterium]|nr:LysM peptidoglycan-binding domain-containing protein [Myxococcales bacterium]MCB9657062.1 LysM peptidoglycan-binding domain-containing protein [Sandaracinaceae bacterium]